MPSHKSGSRPRPIPACRVEHACAPNLERQVAAWFWLLQHVVATSTALPAGSLAASALPSTPKEVA
jgi:hypothetical protein